MRRARVLTVAATIVATALVALFVANLALGDKHIEQRVETLYASADAQFRRIMNVIFGPPLVGGNQVRALVNGDVFFADMLEAIANAKRTITFESYIFWSGEIGERFTQALIERAQAGVKVHALRRAGLR